jgi:L-lactate dehydrogenase (cytochrome)
VDRAESIFCISHASGYALEQIAEASKAPLWFQLFSCTNREIARSFLDRARATGCEAIILGVDLPIGGLRYRDDRNGLSFPPRPRLRDLVDFLRHPRWLAEVAGSGKITLGNYADVPEAAGNTHAYLTTRVLTPACSWEDLAWLRREWGGPVVVKGIMSPADALRAVECGADAIVVSNHGGRQLDWQPATIDVLPEIADAVGGRAEILLDGGVRHGADVVKAIALGARACLVARPWYWGLAAGGEHGVDEMFRIFRHEIANVTGLIGCPDIGELDASFLRHTARGT